MSHVVLFDAPVRSHLLPLTYSRPVGDLRVGTLTIAEKWHHHLGMPVSFLTQDYLQDLFPLEYGDLNLLINGNIIPTAEIVALILDLAPGEAYVQHGELVAACLDRAAVRALAEDEDFGDVEAFEINEQPLLRISRPADIFTHNATVLREDFALITAGRDSAPVSPTNTIIGPPENLFLEPGARMEACIINVEQGPVYLGKDSVVLEGSMLRGPLSVGEGAVIKMGAKIYGGTTLGPGVKVGGEINNVVFQANSNKGHDGFLGNAVVGEWCNIGADTNASNLRNDYGEVRVWDYVAERFAKTGLQFHGLVMADHAKIGINTMLNTGTVIGFAANVFGEGFPRTFIPSFAWGGAGGYQTFRIDKAMETAERMMQRRGKTFGEQDKALFAAVFEQSEKYRKF